MLSCEALEPKQLLAADVAVQFSNQVLDATSPVTVAIEGKFDLSEVSGTVVQMATNAPVAEPNVYVALFDDAGQVPTGGRTTPDTVQNFLSYVNSSAYDNSLFHRSVSGFVLQGGGFTAPTIAADQPGSDPTPIVAGAVVQNEPGNSNVFGTIAMAKLGDLPDSATNQFFFNMADNEFLDTQNGGFTTFGEVLGSGMTAISTMNGALTYDATEYYFNSALSELPLYNINTDNIVQVQDFVKINTVDVVSESDLMTYQVTTSDTSKLTASFDSNGDLVLTPLGTSDNPVVVTVTATSILDNSTASDTFSVTLGGQAGPTITPIESLGSTVLGKDATGKLYAGVQAISYEGQHLTETRFAAFTPLAVEDFGSNGGKQMLFEKIDGSYSLWGMTSSWAYQSNIIIGAGDTSAINAALVKFGLADPAPTLTAIEAVGNTVLNQDQDGNFYADNSAITFLSNSETVQLNAAIYNPLEVIAVDDFGADGGKQLVFKVGTTAIYVWALDSNWQRDTSGTQIIHFSDSSGIETQEVRFGIDINGGGIGSPLSPVESQGSVILQQSGSGALFAGTDAITYLRNGVVAQLTTSSFGSLQVLAVDDFGGDGGKQLVFKAGTTEIYVWALDSNWQRDTSGTQIIRFSDSSGIETQEVRFDIDINGSGIGSQYTPVESQGAVALQRNDAGALFAGTQPITHLKNGVVTQLTTSSFSGLQIIAVDDFGENGGKQLVFKATNEVYTWTLDANWQRDTGVSSEVLRLNDLSSIDTKETAFGIDINGAGVGEHFIDVETEGSTRLRKSSGAGAIYADDQPITQMRNGAPVQIKTSDYANLDIVAVEDLGVNGKQLLFKASAELYIWRLDVNWQRDTGVSPEVLRLNDLSSIDTKETAFGIDINGAGVGEHFIDVETEGSTRLRKSSVTGVIYADDQPLTQMRDGAPVQIKTSDYANLDIVAVEDLGANGKQLVFKASAELYIWTLDVNWQRDTDVSPEIIRLNDSAAIDARELAFGTDFNGGGVGSVLSDIETAGSTLLQQNLAGALFASGSPIMYLRSGVLTQLTTSTYGNSIQVVAIEDLGAGNGGKQLVFDAGSKLYFWTMTAGWQRDTSTTEILALSDTDEVRAREILFGVDFDGGGIGS
ncbi:peptidylprolyl isomerase [Pirellulales bacterium]|nr:peptidylprolyl isomerase [Pirellulales bacterium]